MPAGSVIVNVLSIGRRLEFPKHLVALRRVRLEVHRFLRYAMTMRLLDESLGAQRLERAYHFGKFHEMITDNIDSIVATLLSGDEESQRLAEQLKSWYPPGRCRWARASTDQLLATVGGWSPADAVWSFGGDPEPRPSSLLRVTPRA